MAPASCQGTKISLLFTPRITATTTPSIRSCRRILQMPSVRPHLFNQSSRAVQRPQLAPSRQFGSSSPRQEPRNIAHSKTKKDETKAHTTIEAEQWHLDSTTTALFQDFEASFPSAMREDKWYLAAIGSLIGSNKASLCGDLYTYLISKPQYTTAAQRQRLVRRMREAMVKCIILNGIPVCFEAVLSVAIREREEDKDYSFSRDGWVPDKANEERALKTLDFLYRDDFAKIMDRFHAHADFPFISTHVSYGLFIANNSILDLQESELVILPAIMCQNLSGPTLWHLRACMRAGISREDTDAIQQCIKTIADFAQRPIDKVGSVMDVKEELYNL